MMTGDPHAASQRFPSSDKSNHPDVEETPKMQDWRSEVMPSHAKYALIDEPEVQDPAARVKWPPKQRFPSSDKSNPSNADAAPKMQDWRPEVIPSHSAYSDSRLTWSAEPSDLCGVQPPTKIHRGHSNPTRRVKCSRRGKGSKTSPFVVPKMYRQEHQEAHPKASEALHHSAHVIAPWLAP
jgi:hypothetical protein